MVENRPGAGQQIGVNAVAKATPDGYTLLMATSSAMGVNPTLYKKIAYDPVADFQPIAMMAHLPFILVVNNDLPVKNLAEFIKYAKANPGKLSYGSGGVGASHHLYGEMFNSLAGVQDDARAVQGHSAGAERRDRGAHPGAVQRRAAGVAAD